MADAARLARIHRVREVQARLAQADEARARDRAAAEAALHDRIAGLVAAVAPKPATAPAATLAAAAYLRDRLNASAATAAARVEAANAQLDRSRHGTREALRDRTAVRKLLERAQAEEAREAARTPDEAGLRARDRHDPCS